ncbi:isopeptide-forming domain-containing fimbrial protein [Bifidobacterium sp. ESL0764]|uniref:isopeptide-forming domain-containing fimbrial protein n=1 Tax=Bifidobacterium sp. ESL0764 TaxID=2983228 RepID=UPI0023F8AD0C|nr:isopeptide-forming domain-containing fimbrial protein [Bifidobacterium sp. ESL0764]WEV65418.1 isopeptide-forming domain-containing fimbrial protein [Bifidobacterium sp. ESL0764]
MRKQHFRVGALSARHALSADGHSSDLYESQEKQGQAILSGTGHMKKKQWKRALGALVSCLVAAATLMSGAVSANASQPDAEQTPTHGPQPYVTLKIKSFHEFPDHNGGEIYGTKLADYTNQERDKNTLDATTVSKIHGGNYTYKDLCDASGYGDACSADDPMRWLVDKWSAEGDADETTGTYTGHVRDFVDNLKPSSSGGFNYSGSFDWKIWNYGDGYKHVGGCRNVQVTRNEANDPIYSIDITNGIYLIEIGGQRSIVSTVGGYLDTSRPDYLGSKEIIRKGGSDSQITKTVKNKTYNVGDSAEYTINVALPKNLTDPGVYYLKVVDKFSAGLSYVKDKFDPTVTLDGVNIPRATNANPVGYKLYVYDKTCNREWDNCQIVYFNYKNLVDSSDEVPEARIYFDLWPYIHSKFGNGTPGKDDIIGKSLKIVYHAVVNSNAGKGDPVDNNAKMWYDVDTCGCGKPTEISGMHYYLLASRVRIYSGGFSLQQGSEWKDGIMEGATFNVFHKEDQDHPIRFNEVSKGSATEPSQYCAASASATNSTDKITIGPSGKANVTGLADGTYIVKQLTAAHGWTVVPDFAFEITIQHDDNGDGTEKLTQSIGSNPYGMASLGGGAGGNNGRVVNVRYIQSLRDVPATSPVGMGARALLGVMTVLCGAGILVGARKLKRRSDMSGLNV